MKPQTLLATLAALAALAVGCDKPTPTVETTTQQLNRVEEKTAEVAQDLKNYTYAQKGEFLTQMRSQVAALNRDLDQLAAKIETSSDVIKTEAKPRLQTLRDQTAKLNSQLDEVKNATESTWDSVKAGVQNSYEASKEGFNQARQWASEKLAP